MLSMNVWLIWARLASSKNRFLQMPHVERVDGRNLLNENPDYHAGRRNSGHHPKCRYGHRFDCRRVLRWNASPGDRLRTFVGFCCSIRAVDARETQGPKVPYGGELDYT